MKVGKVPPWDANDTGWCNAEYIRPLLQNLITTCNYPEVIYCLCFILYNSVTGGRTVKNAHLADQI